MSGRFRFVIAVVMFAYHAFASQQIVYGQQAEPVRLFANWAARTGHAPPTYSSSIRKAVLSRDNRLALTAARSEHRAILWKVNSGRILRVFVTDASVVRVAFLPDATPVTGTSRGVIVLWDAATGEPLRTIKTGNSLMAMKLSEDGRLLVAGQSDGTITVWNVATGRKTIGFKITSGRKRSSRLRDLDLNKNATRLLTVQFDGTIGLWDVEKGKAIRQWDSKTRTTVHARLSDDGRRALTATLRKKAIVWNMENGRKIREFSLKGVGSIRGVSMSRDGERILFGRAGSPGKAEMRNVDSGELLREFRGHQGSIYAIDFNHDESKVITGAGDLTAAVWDSATGRRLQVLRGLTRPTYQVAASGAGAHLLVRSQGLLSFWNLQAGTARRIAHGFEKCVSPALSHDGSTAAAALSNGEVTVWKTNSGTVRGRMKIRKSRCTVIAVNRDGSRVVTGHQDGSITIWGTASGRALKTVQIPVAPVAALTVSLDGKKLLSGHSATQQKPGTAVLWEVASGRRLHRYEQKGSIHSVAMTDDGKRFLTAGSSDAQLRETASGKIVRRFSATHSFGERSFMNSDGSLLLLHSPWNEARLYTPTGRTLQKFKHGNLPSIAFTGNGSLFWKSKQHHISAMDVKTGREVLRLLSLNKGVDWLAYTPQGLYDGSEEARKLVAFTINGAPEPLLASDKIRVQRILQRQSRIRLANLVPGLVSQIYKGRRPRPKPVAELARKLTQKQIQAQEQEATRPTIASVKPKPIDARFEKTRAEISPSGNLVLEYVAYNKVDEITIKIVGGERVEVKKTRLVPVIRTKTVAKARFQIYNSDGVQLGPETIKQVLKTKRVVFRLRASRLPGADQLRKLGADALIVKESGSSRK